MRCIKVHCGSAHVRGKAREYAYFVASAFETRVTLSGRKTWKNAGLICGPFRSFEKTQRLARKHALETNTQFVEGYGSLHNKEATSEA